MVISISPPLLKVRSRPWAGLLRDTFPAFLYHELFDLGYEHRGCCSRAIIPTPAQPLSRAHYLVLACMGGVRQE